MQNSFRHFEYYKEAEEIYCRKNPTDDDFLKYMSDKRGTHVDVGHSLVVALINDTDKIGLTPVYYFALQMICAAKEQIPELAENRSEMPDLIDGN